MDHLQIHPQPHPHLQNHPLPQPLGDQQPQAPEGAIDAHQQTRAHADPRQGARAQNERYREHPAGEVRAVVRVSGENFCGPIHQFLRQANFQEAGEKISCARA